MLNDNQREILDENQGIFQPEGKPTSYAQHHMTTGDHPPIAVPPYRMTPSRQQILKSELDELISPGII